MSKETKSLPMVALRGLTVLPGMVRHFDEILKSQILPEQMCTRWAVSLPSVRS